MVKYIVVDVSPNRNPYLNQTIESAFMDFLTMSEIRLYFWTNSKCVFIGRNQDATSEVDIDALEKNGGCLCRRLSGGGAVYHDEGNLNFSIICMENNFNSAQFSVILLNAFRSLGVKASLSGRNDIEADGKKFSGNAYLKQASDDIEKECLHHGTVLLHTSEEDVQRYLTPNVDKLAKRGVASVSSRIVPLDKIVEDITPEKVTKAIVDAFAAAYPTAEVVEDEIGEDEDWSDYADVRATFESDEWKYYGKKPQSGFDLRVQSTIDGSRATVCLELNGSFIKAATIFTDALDVEKPSAIEFALVDVDIEDFDAKRDMLDGDTERVLMDIKRKYEHEV